MSVIVIYAMSMQLLNYLPAFELKSGAIVGKISLNTKIAKY